MNTQATEPEPRNIKRKPLLVTIPLLFTGFFYVYIDIDVNWKWKGQQRRWIAKTRTKRDERRTSKSRKKKNAVPTELLRKAESSRKYNHNDGGGSDGKRRGFYSNMILIQRFRIADAGVAIAAHNDIWSIRTSISFFVSCRFFGAALRFIIKKRCWFHFSMFPVARTLFFLFWFYLRIFRYNLRALSPFYISTVCVQRYHFVCVCVCKARIFLFIKNSSNENNVRLCVCVRACVYVMENGTKHTMQSGKHECREIKQTNGKDKKQKRKERTC